MQTNVFTWIRTVFTHLIISCAIRYPKIGNLHYVYLKPGAANVIRTLNIMYIKLSAVQ